jgi:RNA polymerase sigma-70 factor (ECF subfamily)
MPKGSDTDVATVIIDVIPSLRALAQTLADDRDRADDAVHDTMVETLHNLDLLPSVTNIRAWLFGILHDQFFPGLRSRRLDLTDDDDNPTASPAPQLAPLETGTVVDFRVALMKLPREQREALILVGPAGFSDAEAAGICGCSVGAIGSRIDHARTRLTEMLGGEPTVNGAAVLHLRPGVIALSGLDRAQILMPSLDEKFPRC